MFVSQKELKTPNKMYCVCVCVLGEGARSRTQSAQEAGSFTFYTVFIHGKNEQTSGLHEVKSQLHFWNYLWQS